MKNNYFTRKRNATDYIDNHYGKDYIEVNCEVKDMQQGIIIEELSKSYTSKSTDIFVDGKVVPAITRQVLSNLSFDIPAGKITAILGRSGCGKSTLLRIMNGEENADSGSIQMPDGWHSALLKPVPYLISWTSVLKNVEMAVSAGTAPEERIRIANRLLELVQLSDYADMIPDNLSSGMKQRLGLARVLAGNSELLLMDEPFAALDFVTREELQQVLLMLQKECARTIVLVTHQLEEALLLADRIIVLHNDCSVDCFTLSQKQPRNLDSEEFSLLREQISACCRLNR